MKKIISLMISLVLLAPLAFAYEYETEPDPVEAKYYDDAKVLRVKHTQGEAYVKRSYEDGFEEAAVNLPIFEKDAAGTTDGRLEVYMGRLNYLRLDYDTEVVFDKVPALRKTDLSLKVMRGGIYLDIENLDYERDIEVQTPDCGVFLLDRGAYRINVSEGGRTEIYVYDGVAEVAGNNYSRNVRENQKIVMFNGQVKERPFYFYSTDKDEFDRWNQERNGVVGYARYGSSQYLDSGYEEYEYELSRHGRWRYHDTYNTYIWIPYSVGSDWRPYYHGRWIWNPFYGYVWNSFDNWGYFTHHYGRWHWDPFYNWHWIPGYHWSPAWVSWFGDDYYYGWCPLSWWNRPVVVYNGHWWRNHHYNRHGVPFHARSTTIIRKSQLSSSGIHRSALTHKEATKLSKKSLVFRGNAPNVRPTDSRVDVINARGKRVVYKKNGLVSPSKYKVMKTTTGISRTKNESPVYQYSGKKLAKEKFSKYTKSPYTKSSTYKSKSYKYDSSEKSEGYKIKKYPSSGSSPGNKSKTKYRSGSSSSSSSSSGQKSTIKKSSTKSSSSSSSSRKSSGSKSKTIKKKKDEPSYSYQSSGSSSSSSTYSSSSPYSSRSYSSRTYKKKPSSSSSSSYQSPNKSRGSTKSYSSSNKSYTSSYKSSYKKPTKSYSDSSYRSRSSSSAKSYRGSSYSSRSSSSSKSYSRPSSSSRSSSKSYSRPSSSSRSSSSSYKSSSRSSSSSSSRSSSSRSSSSRSSSSSSSIKKKNK